VYTLLCTHIKEGAYDGEYQDVEVIDTGDLERGEPREYGLYFESREGVREDRSRRGSSRGQVGFFSRNVERQ